MSKEELTGNVARTGDEPVVAPVEGAAPVAPVAEPVTPPIAKVDLTESAEFRQWQSAADKRTAQLEARLAEAARQQVATQAQLEQFQIAGVEPEEAVQYLQGQLAQERKDREEAQVFNVEAAKVDDAAMQMLKEAGLDRDDPGLDWSGGQSWEGVAALARSVAAIERLRVTEQTKATEAEVAKAAHEAKAQALDDAGVTKVDTATGPAPDGLRAKYEAEISGLRRAGNATEIRNCRARYRSQGLPI